MSEMKSKSNSRNNSHTKKSVRNKKKSTKGSTKRTKPSSKNQVEESISSLITQFDNLFIDKETSFDKKKIKEFARNTLIIKDSQNNEESASINYQNFIILLLKLCGLEIDLNADEEKQKFLELDKNSSIYTAEKELDNLLLDLKIRRDKIKNRLLTNNLNEIVTQVYNIFDFTNFSDYKKFKEFIRAIFKLTQNHTRKIRILGTMILCKITELIIAEYGKNKKLLKQSDESKDKKSQKKSASKNKKSEDNSYRMRYNLCNNLSEYINDIKKNFLLHKICDYSREIRMLICDMMERVSKHYFNIIFGEFKLVEYFNFFLQDPCNNIRVKYLQIIYDRLNSINTPDEETEKKDEKEKKIDEFFEIEKNNDSKKSDFSNYQPSDDELKESMSIIIDILNKTKSTILSICVKEDSFLAKSGIKILELLSKQSILEAKTVNNLLLHLFNDEPKIRALISQITINYILNFEQPDNKGEIPKPSLDHVHLLNQLALRLTGKVSNMMKVFVEDFFYKLKIITNYKLLFEYVNNLLNEDEIEFDLLQNIFILIDNSIKIVKIQIEEKGQNEYIKKHDDFCEQLINKISEFIKKLRFAHNEDDIKLNSHYELINNLLQLLENFRLYPQSSFNIQFETIKQILFELKKTFFISTSIINIKNDDIDLENDNSKKNKSFKIKQSQSQVTEEKNFENYLKSNYACGIEKLCENILKGMSSILNDHKLFELFNYNQTDFLDQIIYSMNDTDNTDCLAYIFFKTFQDQIVSHAYFSEIAQNSGSSDLSEVNKLIEENYNEHIIYILVNQFNQLLVYFPKIFSSVGGINFYEFEHFLITLLRCKIQNFKSNDNKIIEFNYNYITSLLNLIDTLHLRLFNNNIEYRENINEYIEIRNRIVTMLFYIMSLSFSIDDNKTYNSFLYLIKGKCLGLFLDIYMLTTHEKIQINELQFELIPNLMSIFYIFVRNNFIRFLWEDYIENEPNLNNENNDEDNQSNNSKTKNEKPEKKEKKEIFWSSYKLQIYILKIFAEKFSRLLLVNFKTFLNEPLCLLYFEAFFLLPQSSIIQQITDYTLETLMTKEINQYIKYNSDNEEKAKEEPNTATKNKNNEDGKIYLMLYYMNKVVLRIFNNESQLYNDENNPHPFDITYEQKLDICQRYINSYIKVQKKLKLKFKDKPYVMEKDKIPYENYILNGIAFALDKSSVINDYICLDNVYFLEFIKIYIKNGIFVDEEMIHDIIITYIKLAKKWEITENMNLIHIRFMEKFKSYILNKGHMKIVENKNDNEEEKKDSEEKEYNNDNEEEPVNEEEEDKKKKSKKNKKKKGKKSVKRKKRTHNEVIKEENEEEEEPKIPSRKTKKEK